MVGDSRFRGGVSLWAAFVLLTVLTSWSQNTLAQQLPKVHVDDEGNIHIDTSKPGTVMVNGQDLGKMVEQMWDLFGLGNEELLLSIGGFGSSSFTGVVEAYNGTTWRDLPAVPAVGYASAAVFRGRVYVAVGRDATGLLDRVESYGGESSPWRTEPSLPTARISNNLVAYDNKWLFSIGGDEDLETDVGGIATVSVFDGSSWSSAPPLPGPLNEAGACVFNGKIVVAGGLAEQGSRTMLNAVHELDVDEWTWSTWTQALPTARAGLGLAEYKGQLYAVGGMTSTTGVNTVEVFDGQTWDSAPSLNDARMHFGLAVYKDMLYAVGGFDSTFVSSIETFNGQEWTVMGQLAQPRTYLAVVVWREEKIWEVL